jgi:4-amino-4-deoxy-L-arabinose transferase-like glycosyltransferase
MRALRHNLDFVLLAIIIAAFVAVAAERLGSVPVPDTDEAMTLQVPYEMLNRGKLAFPMFHYLGGNIENVWHSYTPVFFLALSGFQKVFGWGLVEGRAFNLATAALLLVMLYLVGRRLFGWQVGLIAVVFVISDPVFFARARLVRNDMLAATFGLLAFYLYDLAEEKRSKWLYIASGFAAGAGVMCHTNLIYMLAVIFALMLGKRGWQIIKSSSLYLFAAGAFAAMAYEILYDLIDYRNFLLQNRKDDVHFRILEPAGWLHNIIEEPQRYIDWYNARGLKFAPGPALLQVLLILAAAAIIYLVVRAAIRIKRGDVMSEPRARVVVALLVVMLFFAVVTQRKVLQYTIHLSPWFALAAAVMLKDLFAKVGEVRRSRRRWSKPVYATAVAAALLMTAGYGYALARQNRRYLAEVQNPDLASFDDIRAALRTVVPEGVCPASIGSGYIWLAFPEHDLCYFAHMEARLDEPLNLDGKEYALIVRPRFLNRLEKLTGGAERFHLLGELKKTVYGTFLVYYTGSDPRYLAQRPKRYYFFGPRRGVISDEQIAAAREVWAAVAAQLTNSVAGVKPAVEPGELDDSSGEEISAGGELINLASVELKPHSIYYLRAQAGAGSNWELLVLEEGTGAVIQRASSNELNDQDQLEAVFKTSALGRVRLAIRHSRSKQGEILPIARVSISEVADK